MPDIESSKMVHKFLGRFLKNGNNIFSKLSLNQLDSERELCNGLDPIFLARIFLVNITSKLSDLRSPFVFNLPEGYPTNSRISVTFRCR